MPIVRDGSCRHCWENTNGDCGGHGPLIIQTGYPHVVEDTPFGHPLHPEGSRMFHDDPAWDCTDAAHPAWWRGHQHTATVFCNLVEDILDGKDDGKGFNYEPWHHCRQRLLMLVRNYEGLLKAHLTLSRLIPEEQRAKVYEEAQYKPES